MCVDWGVSIRKACGVICFDTSTYHYKSRRTDQAAVERRIKEIAETRVRYGYRRVHVLLRREGWVINMKKTRRIYNELGLQLRNKQVQPALMGLDVGDVGQPVALTHIGAQRGNLRIWAEAAA